MKRQTVQWRKDIVWYILVSVFAVLVALWGLRAVPPLMRAGLYMPDHLMKLYDKFGPLITATIDGKLDPNPWVKFVEMWIMQSIWYFFVRVAFRMKLQNKSDVIKWMIVTFGGAFSYGMLMTVVWFFTGNRMNQLTTGFIFYVGVSYGIWVMCMGILACLSEIVLKSTVLSIGTQILRYISVIYAYLIAPLWYYWFYAEGFSYDAYWVPFMTKQIVVFMNLLKYFLVFAVIIAILGAIILIYVCNVLIYTKKEDAQNVNDASACNKLIVYVSPGEILHGANLSFEWLCFLMENGNKTFRTRHMAAYLQGENMITSLHHYVTGKVNVEKYEEKICLFWENDISQLQFSKEQWKRIELFLKDMEQKGFKIILNQQIWATKKDKEKNVPERILYHKYPIRVSESNNIPFGIINEYDKQKSARSVYIEMDKFLKEKEIDSFLLNSVKRLCLCEDSVVQFYTLLKMSEYCIHRRALYEISREGYDIIQNEEKLKKVAFGTWIELHNTKNKEYKDAELAGLIRKLDLMAARNSTSTIKTSKVSYSDITKVMVNLRNRFVGHGTMIYSIEASMLYPMARAVLKIIEEYVSMPHELNEKQRLLPGVSDKQIRTIWEKGNKIYLFNGIDQFGYRDYLNYETGEFLTIEKDGSCEIKNYPVIKCKAGKETKDILNKANTGDEEQGVYNETKKKFLHDYKNASLLEVCAGSDELVNFYKDIESKYFNHETYEECFEESEFHEGLLKMDVEKIVHLWDSEYWDCMGDEWDDPMPLNRMVIFLLLIKGELVPKVPLRLGLLGKSRYSFENRYTWIRSLEMKQFESYTALLSWASNVPVSKNKINSTKRYLLENQSDYAERDRIYRRIIKELKCTSLLKSGGIYIAGFMKNIFDYDDISTSTMALFDFVEFILQSVQYTVMEISGAPVEGKYVNPDIREMGRLIKQYAQEGSVLNHRVNNCSLIIPERCMELHKEMKNYLPLEFQGEEMDFDGLMRIMALLRNTTKAHGVIREEHVGTLWSLLLYYVVMCAVFLDLEHYEIFVSGDNFIYAGYHEGYNNGYVPMEKYFILNDDVPCLLWEYKAGKKYYINYFHGNYVIPDILEK